MDEAFDAYNLERIRSAGTVLLGRSSFEGFSSTGRALPMPLPIRPPARSVMTIGAEPDLQRIAQGGGVRHLRRSRRQRLARHRNRHSPRQGRRPVDQGTQPGAGDILTFASRTMSNGLLRQGLVDELHLMVGLPH